MSGMGEFTWGHQEQDAHGGQSVEYKDMYPATHGLARSGNQMAAQRTKDFYNEHKEKIWCGIAGVAGAIVVGCLFFRKKKDKSLLYSGHRFGSSDSMYSGKLYSSPMSYSHNYF